MRQHKNLVANDTNTGQPIDSPLQRIQFRTPTFAKDPRRDVDISRTAELLLRSRAIRSEQFRAIMSDIDDISWHILVGLAAAKSSGTPVTAHGLAITHNIALSTMARYVYYLANLGLVAKSQEPQDEGQVVLKLTAYGDAQTSNALRNIGRELAEF